MNNVQQCRISAGLTRWFSCDENEGLHTTIGGNYADSSNGLQSTPTGGVPLLLTRQCVFSERARTA